MATYSVCSFWLLTCALLEHLILQTALRNGDAILLGVFSKKSLALFLGSLASFSLSSLHLLLLLLEEAADDDLRFLI